MDNEKKDKLVAIIVTALVSLAVSIIACIFGIDADKIMPAPNLASESSAYCAYDA